MTALRLALPATLSMFVLSACAPALPLPSVPRPPVVRREDALADLPLSTLSLPLGMPVTELEALLRERVPLPNAPDFVLVSEPGESPEVAVRYAASWRAPELASAGDTLLATLPIAYHGAIRARAKTPFGWVWLTKGTDWGRPDAEGQIALALAARVDVGEDWSVTSHTELRDVQLSAPPVSQLCTSGLFKVCVPAEWATARVHRELERRVRSEVVEGLAQLDSQVRERAQLAGLAAEVWRRLQRERTIGAGTLTLAPERLGIGAPTLRGDTLVADLRLWCRPVEVPAGPERPLGPPARDVGEPDHVALRARVSPSEIAAAFQRSLAATPVALGATRITGVSLVGAAEQAERFVFAITLADDGREATLYVRAALVGDGPRLAIDAPDPTPESVRLLAALGVPEGRLLAVLTQAVRADLSAALALRVDALRSLLADAVAPWPSAPLPAALPELAAVHAAADGLLLDVRVLGAR